MAAENGERSVVRRALPILWRYVRAQPVTFGLSMVGATLYAGAAVGTTVVLGRITNDVVLPAFGPAGVTQQQVRAAGLVLFLIGVLRGLSIVLRRYVAALTTFRTQAALRRRVTDHYLDVPLRFHRDRPTGELLAHADADVIAATDVLNPLPFSVGVIVLIVFSLVSLAIVDPVLTLIALLVFPSLALLNRMYTQRIEVPAGEVQARVGDVSSLAHESIDGALVVKTLGLADREVQRMEVAADELREARIRMGRIRALFEPGIDVIPNLGQIVLLLVGAWRISAGELNPGELVQAVALFSLLAFPMRVVGFFLQEMPRAVVTVARLDAMFDGAGHARGMAPALPSAAMPAGPLGVRFDHVDFSYEPGVPVLRDVSFDVSPGEIVAIVGPTGSGKTTLCELLVRLVEPDGGAITVGGIAIESVDPAALRDAVALVFQETFLFADSVRTNIELGLAVDADLHEAMRVAQADGFVQAMTAGLDTVVGERGITLSGGQRQRVALARALHRRPRVLLLDDATSAVDPVVEAQILQGLRQTLSTTTLIVAHRVSTIMTADRVIFMEHGTVSAVGTHEELLARPAYERIVRAYEVDADVAPLEVT